jgi:hypothetical protein
MGRRIGACLLALVGALVSAPALAWEASDLPELKTKFASGISAKYTVTEAGWMFSSDCEAADCYGTNPDSPYGLPVFVTGANADRKSKARQLAPTDAVVVIMETPPPARYFGVTPYLYKRLYPGGIPTEPGEDIVVPVFESLGDTINQNKLGTTGAASAPPSEFSELAVFVMTADKTTYDDVYMLLSRTIGFPNYAVNRLTLPIHEVPLIMGISQVADTFSLVSRTAYPEDPAALQDYIARNPVAVFHLKARTARNVAPIEVIPPRTPGRGYAEDPAVALERDALVETLRRKYLPDYKITERVFVPKQTKNYLCIDWGLECNGDNPDAIYTTDIDSHVPSSREDKVLIVGVNHKHLSRATYFSHALVDPSNKAGLVAIGDEWIEQGRSFSDVPNVYALTISYECHDDPTCLTIPEPTSSNPDGLPFGHPFSVTGRTYLDPDTDTRPAIEELIFHRVFILTKR